MPEPNDVPRFVHDCTTCVFLGTYTPTVKPWNWSGDTFDLYVCGMGDDKWYVSLIARYGSDGPEYLSGNPYYQVRDIAVLTEHYPLVECEKRYRQLTGVKQESKSC